MLPSLTRLSWSGHSTKSTVAAVLALLLHTPLLRSLAIYDSSMISGEDVSPHIAKCHVNLPHLERLDIYCDVIPCAELVAHISFPPEGTMHLTVDDLWRETQPQALEPIVSVINRITAPQPLRTLLIAVTTHLGWTLELKGWSSILSHESCSHQTPAKIHLTAMRTGFNFETVLQRIGKCLPLSHVKYLQIENVPDFDVWKKSFAHMRTVTKLRVHRAAADYLPIYGTPIQR